MKAARIASLQDSEMRAAGAGPVSVAGTVAVQPVIGQVIGRGGGERTRQNF
jgi:hypothetical protein